MKLVPLTRNKCTIVDAADYPAVIQCRWYCSKEGYAVRNRRLNGKQFTQYLHKALMGVGSFHEVDHINGDKLDNRRKNLRIVRGGGNQQNVPKRRNNTSGFKGVFWHEPRKKWRAQIKVEGKIKYLGLFRDKLDAARAYNDAAIRYHGEFARINVVK